MGKWLVGIKHFRPGLPKTTFRWRNLPWYRNCKDSPQKKTGEMISCNEDKGKTETWADEWEHVSKHFSCHRRICNFKGFLKIIIYLRLKYFALNLHFSLFKILFDFYDEHILLNMLWRVNCWCRRVYGGNDWRWLRKGWEGLDQVVSGVFWGIE